MADTQDQAISPRTETIGLPTRRRPPPVPPPQIPDYRILKTIGRGAFGTVWLAEEVLAGLFRAVKVLHPPAPARDEKSEPADPTPEAEQVKRKARIDRELEGIHAYQTQARDHPHLVRILKTGLCTVSKHAADNLATPDSNGPISDHPRQAVYYVMEIADHAGGAQPRHPTDYEPLTLATLLRRQGRLPVTAANRPSLPGGPRQEISRPQPDSTTAAPSTAGVVELALALHDAIDHLHRAGIHHRDIKPSNILFVDGVLKLADLGLVSSENVESVGTAAYMPLDARPDDLYALGKIIYQMTTGLAAHDFPEWPADLDPAAEPRLKPLRALISRLCDPAPGRRLADARNLRHHLNQLRFSPGRAVLPRRLALGASVAALVLGLLIGVAATQWWHRQQTPTARRFARPPFDGSQLHQIVECDGRQLKLSRLHGPGLAYAIGSQTVLRVWDIETRLANGRLEVCGSYQIYNVENPLTGGITVEGGEINQVYLVAGDAAVLLYHGQPGPEPGISARLGRSISLDRIIPRVEAEGGAAVGLTYVARHSPQDAERDLVTDHIPGVNRIELGWVEYYPRTAPQPARADRQP